MLTDAVAVPPLPSLTVTVTGTTPGVFGAVQGVCRRPAVSIRRARLGKVFLADLVGNGTLSPQLAEVLRAAVAARKNIMVAGPTNAGKTTLLRALANEIPASERLITVERPKVDKSGATKEEQAEIDAAKRKAPRPNTVHP